MPIYIKSGAIIVRQPFDKRIVTGRANLAYYSQLRFDIYPDFGGNDGSKDFMGDAWIYEDDGLSMDYLNSESSSEVSVQTWFNYSFNVTSNSLKAMIWSTGNYNGFPSTRYYSVGIKNVFPPEMGSVSCNGESLDYLYLWYGAELATQNGWYFDSTKMTVFINCPESSTSYVPFFAFLCLLFMYIC